MRWRKQGVIYAPDGTVPWAAHSALQPTPLKLEDAIRIYVGCRDAQGVSSIGYVDIDARDPGRVLGVSERPVLYPGEPGTFDDNGVVPTAIVRRQEMLYLYYAGYQISQKVRFLAFGGVAASTDGGETFERVAQVPMMDRSDEGLYFRVPHTVLLEGDVWKIWYGAGSHWVADGAKTLPVYDIRYLESSDGVSVPPKGRICIPVRGGDEHRVGRPAVFRHDGIYKMLYAVGTKSRGYRIGYAESEDGKAWVRMDDRVGIDVSADGWDSQTISYPAVVQTDGHAYLFYNGNDYGKTGFGYAVLEEW